jgi:AraC-like DNA-binding protein
MDGVIDESAWRVPGAGLRPFVSWCSGFRQAGVGATRHRGLPSPDLTFIITLDDPLVLAVHPDPKRAPASYESLIGGLHTAPALITHDGRQSGIQLGVTPLGARALFGMPAGELANWDGEATQVVGGFAAELQDRVRAERSWAERFTVIDHMLGKRIAEFAGYPAAGLGGGCRGGVRPEVAYAWRRLRDSHGGVPVSSLAAETGWSTRYLGSRFRAEIGLSPKAAARVFRFDHARRRLGRAATAARGGAGGCMRLADLAAEAGYYDQAHLAAEFRILAGCPPTQWLAEEFRFFQAMPDDLGG